MSLSEALKSASPNATLRATAKSIKTLDILPYKFQDCSDLFLSHNQINNIKNIEQFKFLTRLMLEYNQIWFIDDLVPLSKCPNLKELKIEGNPVCKLPFWNYHVIALCPKLEMLNGKPVNREDVKFFEWEEKILQSLYFASVVRKVLKMKSTNPKLQNEDISNLIANETSKKGYRNFVRDIYSKAPSDPEQYMKYLMNLSLLSEEQSLASFKKAKINNEYTKAAASKYETLKQITDFGEFANQHQTLVATDLNTIGVHSNKEVTDSLANRDLEKQRKKAKVIGQSSNQNHNKSLIEKCIDIASKIKKPVIKVPSKSPEPQKILYRPPPIPVKYKTLQISPSPIAETDIFENVKEEKTMTTSKSLNLMIDPESMITLETNESTQIMQSEASVLYDSPMYEITFEPSPQIDSVPLSRTKTPVEERNTRSTGSLSFPPPPPLVEQDSDASGDELKYGLTFDFQLKRELTEQTMSSAHDLQSEATMNELDSDERAHSQSLSLAGPSRRRRHHRHVPMLSEPSEGRRSTRSSSLLPPLPTLPDAQRPRRSRAKRAARFDQEDWEVKLFVEKRTREFLQIVFDGWKRTVPGLALKPKQRLRRMSSSNSNDLSGTQLQRRGSETIVADLFVSDFLNSEAPARRSKKKHRSRPSSITLMYSPQ